MAMLTGVQEIAQDQLMKLARLTCKNGTNLMTFGPAGIGKTEMAEQAAVLEGFEFIYLNLSVLEAPDLLGLPRVNEAGKTVYAVPEKFPLKGEGKPKVLVVDELDKARPELQNPMLELFQKRSINGTELNIKGILATGNLPDENSFSQPVSHALMNRCSVFRVTHAFEPWQEWAAGQVNPLIVGFLSRNSDFLLQPPPEGDDTAYCHPSPRAWTNAGKDIDASADESVDFQTMLVAGRVGQGAAVKFRVWLDHYRHIAPHIDALIKDGKHPPDKVMDGHLDRLMVCAIAGADGIMEACRSHKANRMKLEQVHKVTDNVMKWMVKLTTDMAIAACKSTLTMESITECQLMKVPAFMETYQNIRKSMSRDR